MSKSIFAVFCLLILTGFLFLGIVFSQDSDYVFYSWTQTAQVETETAIAIANLTPYPIHITETVVSASATANASSPLSFAQTREALISTATAQIFPTSTNAVSFWETQKAVLVQTATLAGGTDEAFYSTAIPAIDQAIVSQRHSQNCYNELFIETRMEYFITDDGLNLTTPQIYNVANYRTICEVSTGIPASYFITLEIDNAAPHLDIEQMVFLVLEDAVSRLPDYPPFDEGVQNVGIGICFATGGWCTVYGDFTRSQALAAYESGMRGADLAEALGVRAP